MRLLKCWVLGVALSLGAVAVYAGPYEDGVEANHALGYLERAGNLVVAESSLQVQTQCFSDLSHGDSVGWHQVRPQKR